MHERAAAILEFWIGASTETLDVSPASWQPEKKQIWFQGGDKVDQEVKQNFCGDLACIKTGEYDSWLMGSGHEAVAGIILMDQLTRNAYRGTADMYCLDSKALSWCKSLVASGQDTSLALVERIWVYMPYMHSELLQDQKDCVSLMEGLAADCNAAEAPELGGFAAYAAKYAVAHQEVVAKWGRFPHRNAILGRTSTPAEEEGLKDGSIPAF